AGQTATYRNVVRRISRLGTWTGRPLEVAVDLAALGGDECDLIVVLVHDAAAGRLGPVVGADITPLR
ncbi:MAG: DUF1223 domain-containing protein, partial [Bacteroidales bacterium]|nr:DUF1223 domain-containing protein [Bacteroidales bacterium]